MLHEVSAFADRHGTVADDRYRAFSRLEEELYLDAPDGPDLHPALVAHADCALVADR